MKGNITRRGHSSWRLKFDIGREAGNRKIQYHTFRGTKREAQTKLAELIASLGTGSYVEPSKTTVAEFVRARVDQWEADGDISARTAQRYRQLVENQIVPHLGSKALQKLKPLDIEKWHTTLRSGGRVRGKGGVVARTVGPHTGCCPRPSGMPPRTSLLAAMLPGKNRPPRSPTTTW
jgi:integrase